MNYIILAAGVGTRLHPLTNESPKFLYKLDDIMTILERTVSMINNNDCNGRIIIVTGFFEEKIREKTKHLKNVKYIYNPFYKVTNSIASLWFARQYLTGDVTILNADIVFDKRLCEEIIIRKFEGAFVLVDSSIKTDGDYNVQIHDDAVTVMSKDLKEYYAEYAGITKLDSCSSKLLLDEVNSMVNKGYYDQWYENALVQMIFMHNFKLKYFDVCDYHWTEVDNVDDLLNAKQIHLTK